MRLFRFVCPITLVALLMSGAAVHLVAQRSVALQPIVAASIENLLPQGENVGRRQVRFHIDTAAPPVCGPAPASVEYGFLIDKDSNRATGIVDPEFDELGIDARLLIRCDVANGRFISSFGQVTTRSDRNRPGLEVTATVGQLPSVDFLWIPYAADGDQIELFEGRTRYARWAILERMIP